MNNTNTVRFVKLKRNKYYKTFINDTFIGGFYLRDFEAVGLKKPKQKRAKVETGEDSVYEKYKIRKTSADSFGDKIYSDKNNNIYKNKSKTAYETVDEEEIVLDDISDAIVEDIEELIYLRAFDKSLDYLSRSEVSASGIRSKLRLKDYSDGIIDRVIEELYSRNYLNDNRFVESYVRSYMRSKSKRLIVKELENIGIDISECSDAIDGVYEDEGITEDEVIEELLRKKYTKEQLTDIKVKRRAMSYLARHGFSFDAINNYLT